MPRLSVTQVRSGEGFLLTDITHLGPRDLPEELPDLLSGTLLIGTDAFGASVPSGGRMIETGLFAFEGEAARAVLGGIDGWGRSGAVVACVPALPDADARRRFIADPLRPWDVERLRATFAVQFGRRFHHRGVWFASERDRQRWVQAAFRRLVEAEGLRLPNGDATIVFELPTDSTFDARFRISGQGEALRIVRDLPAHGVRRTWRIRRGEWEAEERKVVRTRAGSLGERVAQRAASLAIVVLSLPVFALVGLVALGAKVTGSGAAPSSTGPRAERHD